MPIQDQKNEGCFTRETIKVKKLNLIEVGSTEVSKKLLWMMVPDYGTNVLVSLNIANLFSLQKRDKKICDQSSNLKLKRAYFINMLNISKSAHYNSNGYG